MTIETLEKILRRGVTVKKVPKAPVPTWQIRIGDELIVESGSKFYRSDKHLAACTIATVLELLEKP